MENIHADRRIHHHCSFIDVYCFLSPYKFADPLSYRARRITHQQRLYARADRDQFLRIRIWCTGNPIVFVSQKQC